MRSPPYKISCKFTDRFKSYTHLRSSNVRHFGIVKPAVIELPKRLILLVVLNTCERGLSL
jgi:hypothetical protein